MGELKDFAKDNSKYITFEDGEAFEGVFEGWKKVLKDSFGEEKEYIRYKINGKTFDSMSGSLANQMDGVPSGTKVRITRTGKGTDTKYTVEVL
jgi:hypothetical protein